MTSDNKAEWHQSREEYVGKLISLRWYLLTLHFCMPPPFFRD